MISADTFTAICVEISSGRSLRSICQDEGTPDITTVFRSLAVNEEYRQQYARAREAQTDAMLEELLEIADEKTGDPARDRLRLDTRKWAMSKMAPKKYGDKLELAGNPDMPLHHVIERRIVRSEQ